MAIGWGRIAAALKSRLFPGRAQPSRASIEPLLRQAAGEDGLSRAPGGLAERVVAAALAEPSSSSTQARDPAPVDLYDFLMRPRIVGASLASFSAGAALAVHLIDVRAGALVRTLMLGVMQSVTTGGFL